MRFPNAAKGVKKLFTAEILNLIGTLCGIIGLGIIAVGIAAAGVNGQTDAGMAALVGGAAGGMIFVIAYVVLVTIAFILHLVGIINARHDEESFKSALICLILNLVAMVCSGIFTSINTTVASLFYTFGNLMNLFVTLFIISGIIKLADQLNRGDVSAKGSNILKIIVVIAALGLVISIVSSFIMSTAAMVTAMILMAVALILSVVQYIMFLTFLAKAKKMLAES